MVVVVGVAVVVIVAVVMVVANGCISDTSGRKAQNAGVPLTNAPLCGRSLAPTERLGRTAAAAAALNTPV